MPTPIRQAATLALWQGKVCLLTSRSGRRWVIPKGHIERDQTPAQAALAEAWEEGGVRGQLQPEPLGLYHYRKWGKTYRAVVYLLEVQEVAEEWPERAERRREWVPADTAAQLLQEPELRALIERHFSVAPTPEVEG
jgi:8-oxo-dGTP pyrophosphatase MutT (NUDIX family)